VINETIHFENPPAKIPAFPQDTLFECFHVCSLPVQVVWTLYLGMIFPATGKFSPKFGICILKNC